MNTSGEPAPSDKRQRIRIERALLAVGASAIAVGMVWVLAWGDRCRQRSQFITPFR